LQPRNFLSAIKHPVHMRTGSTLPGCSVGVYRPTHIHVWPHLLRHGSKPGPCAADPRHAAGLAQLAPHVAADGQPEEALAAEHLHGYKMTG
jgi:hypothetical protein